MSYFGNHLGHSHGKWWGYSLGALVCRYVLRITSHVRQTVVLTSKVF